MQNIAAKVILNRSKYDSTTECMRELHWLPARSRIKHKILILVHECVNGKASRYQQEFLKEHCQNRRDLRSSRKFKQLKVPFTRKKTFAGRPFSLVGPKWWNELPNKLKQNKDSQQFKKQLEMHVFRELYTG